MVMAVDPLAHAAEGQWQNIVDPPGSPQLLNRLTEPSAQASSNMATMAGSAAGG